MVCLCVLPPWGTGGGIYNCLRNLNNGIVELIVFLSVFGLAALVAGIWACVQIHKTDRSKKETA